MKRFISRLLLAASVAAAVMSCDNKNDGTTITLSPGENQQRLEDIGNRLMSKFQPSVQENLISAADDFINYVYEGDLEIYDKYASNVANNLASVIKSAVAGYNFNSVTTLAVPGSSLYEAARVYGIYTYNGTSWTREDSSDKLEFRFATEEGKQVVATAQASQGGPDLTIEGETYVIPQNVTASVTIDGKTECTVNVNTQCNFKSTVAVNVNLEANGYSISQSLNANSDSGTCNVEFKINGESIVTASSAFGGNHLTDPDYIYDNYETIGGNATAVVSILNEAQLKGSCSDISAMVRELDNLVWDSSNIESARQEAAIYNKYITAGLTYDNATNFVATLEVAPYEDPYTYNGYNPETGNYDKPMTVYNYYTEPLIVFTSDGSRFSLEDYFTEENFGGLIDSFENLYDVYASYVDAAEKEETGTNEPNIEM